MNKRIHNLLLAIGVAFVSITLTVLVVAGQTDGPILARLQPLLVDIQQRLPISVTVAIPLEEGNIQTVTMPIELDLKLQISLSSTLTPVISVLPSSPTLITISELLAHGEPLHDNNKIIYEIEAPEEIEVIQLRSDPNYAKDIEITGEIRNKSEESLQSYQIKLVLTLYNAEGGILGTSMSFPNLDPILIDQISPFTISEDVPLKDVARFRLQIAVSQ